MDFLTLQNEVMSDRFREPKREQIKRWINSRYGRIWAQEAWTFKMAPVTLSVSQNATSVSMGTLQRVHSLWDNFPTSSYSRMLPDRPEDFYDFTRTTGARQHSFTVMGNTIYFDSPAYAATTLTAVGELAFDPLVDDEDEPLLPEEFHYMLVHGAASEGLRLENDPTWEGFEQDYQASLEDLRKSYLTAVRTYGDSSPPFPYGAYYAWG